MNSLSDALAKYVAVRRALGTQFREPAITLGHFVEFLRSEGAEFITTKLALRWAQQPKGVQRARLAGRLSMVRRFASWMSSFDPRTEIPPRGLIEARHRRPKPHIFTRCQIKRLMDEASRLPSPRGLRSLNYVTLIGLLAATGLRPGEALALDIDDVDLENGVLAIRQTKFGKSRFVPLADSTRLALAHYTEQRDKIFPSVPLKAFFVSECGSRLDQRVARHTFGRLCCLVGLRPGGQGRHIGRGPRLQDFRHTFATSRLVEWYRAGLDVQRQMPKLATYLGHISTVHTYWYIEAVPELLQLATEKPTTSKPGGSL